MDEKDSEGSASEMPEEENTMPDDETEFLGAGPDESLEINSSAEETISPKYYGENSK